MRASALIRLVTALLAVLAIDLLFFRALNPLLLAGWSILLALSLSYSHRSVLRGDFIERKTVSVTELRRMQLHALPSALLWSAALIYLSQTAALDDLILFYSVVLLMLVSCATLVAAVPLASLPRAPRPTSAARI